MIGEILIRVLLIAISVTLLLYLGRLAVDKANEELSIMDETQ